MSSQSIEFVGDDVVFGTCELPAPAGGLVLSTKEDEELGIPTALAFAPGLGPHLRVFATPDAIAKAAMSRMRVAWMVVVVRARGMRC